MNLEGFVFVSSTKKVSMRSPGTGLPSSAPHPDPGTGVGATASAGNLGHAR